MVANIKSFVVKNRILLVMWAQLLSVSKEKIIKKLFTTGKFFMTEKSAKTTKVFHCKQFALYKYLINWARV